MSRRGRVWGAKLQPETRPKKCQQTAMCVCKKKPRLCPHVLVKRRSGSWFPGPPPSPESWWNCWICCWGRRWRSCLCTFCGVCWWTHSHRLAAKPEGALGKWGTSTQKLANKDPTAQNLPLVCWSWLLLNPSTTISRVLTSLLTFWHKTAENREIVYIVKRHIKGLMAIPPRAETFQYLKTAA